MATVHSKQGLLLCPDQSSDSSSVGDLRELCSLFELQAHPSSAGLSLRQSAANDSARDGDLAWHLAHAAVELFLLAVACMHFAYGLALIDLLPSVPRRISSTFQSVEHPFQCNLDRPSVFTFLPSTRFPRLFTLFVVLHVPNAFFSVFLN